MPRNHRKFSRRRMLLDCRTGHHRFGPSNEAGGGIVRRTCRHCGSLSIDLTAVETSKAPASFTTERITFANQSWSSQT